MLWRSISSRCYTTMNQSNQRCKPAASRANHLDAASNIMNGASTIQHTFPIDAPHLHRNINRVKTRILLLLAALAPLMSLRAQEVPVIEKTLSNGMKILMVVRHDEPMVSGGWVAHVGSSN